MNMEAVKQKSIKYLKTIGVDTPEHLPQIERLEDVSPRTAQDIASRLSALAYVIGLAYDAKGQDLLDSLNQYELLPYVSEYERQLLSQTVIDEQDKINISWLVESIQALAWCIGIAGLDHFRCCDDDLASKIPFKSDPIDFIRNARLRPIHEIQAQSDLLYRLHWYAREYALTKQKCRFDESVISQRRKAIDWAYGVEEHWDDISLDT